MKISKITSSVVLLLASSFHIMVSAQQQPEQNQVLNQVKQNIKGQVTDDVSRSALAGASVQLQDQGKLLQASITDVDGTFLLTDVAPGRYTILLTCMGYESRQLSDLLVTAGKEVTVTITLAEKTNKLDVVVVTAGVQQNGNNEMALVSSRTFSPEDTRKFAGSLGDPSRMIANGPGIVSGNDSRNDIIVRGNSPNGLLWQLEGIDIPNPNHYGSLNSTGGPVSILNNNNLGRSEFFSGAFPAQYGNAASSAFDLQLRNGNSGKHEFLGEMSFTGFELGAEGPLSKHPKASYLVNYRYSTLGLLHKTGLSMGTGKSVPQYQDLNFKIFLPVSAKSSISLFGLGGPSKVSFLGSEKDTSAAGNVYSGENENLKTSYFKAITGVTLATNFNRKTYGKLSLGYSTAYEQIDIDSVSAATRIAYAYSSHTYKTSRGTAAYNLAHKFDGTKSIYAGISVAAIHFILNDKLRQQDKDLIRLDQDENTLLTQAYLQYKHRITDRLTVTGGIHFQHLSLNGEMAVEPRVGLKYYAGARSILSLGYGLHSQMQSPLVYFLQTHTAGQTQYTNKQLGFTKNQHFVGGYTLHITNTLYIKSEAYFQYLSNVPVAAYSSGYSVLNEGAGFGGNAKDSLKNNGTGSNTGLELTLEKSFSKGYYFMITGSVFDSRYKGSDGIKRNTAFNSHYVLHLLAGKEFKIGRKNNTLSVNLKVSAIGGRYASPIDIAASQKENNTVYDEISAPYSLRQPGYFRADMKAGYRANFRKATLEFGIDLQNFTANKNTYLQKYNHRTGSIITQYQQGFLPIPYLRFTF